MMTPHVDCFIGLWFDTIMATRRLRIRYEASFNLFQQLNSLLYPVSFITDAETHTIKVRQVRTQETIQTLHTLQSFASVYGEIYRDLLKAVSPVIRPYSDNRRESNRIWHKADTLRPSRSMCFCCGANRNITHIGWADVVAVGKDWGQKRWHLKSNYRNATDSFDLL